MSSDVIGEARVLVRPDSTGFDAQVRDKVGGSLRTAAKVAGGALLAGGLVRSIAQQVGAAGALQQNLRESVGLLGQVGPAADRTFGQFQTQVAALSREVGIAQQEISGGLYEALGAGVPKGNAVEFLRVASKASIAGVTELGTTVDGLTTIINAYGLKASDAQKVSDSLFQTVNAGKLTFAELSQSVFNVAPVAAAAGVGLETVGAALATLTAGGVPASVATTQLRYAIQSLVAPSVKAEKLLAPVFKEAGYESGQAALKTLGLQKTLKLVTDAAGGSSTKLTRLLGSSEALNAVLTLTGKGSKLFADQLIAQADAAGVTDKSLAQIEKSAGRSFSRAKVAAENFGLAIGDAAAPAVARLADDLTTGLNRISSSSGFRQGTLAIADGIANAITDPQTIATAQTFGALAVDVFGAVRQAAAATAPAVQAVASALGAIASSPAGPALLLTATAYSVLGRSASAVIPKIVAVRAAQQASAAATAAGVASQVSAIGLVGPSTARAAATSASSFGRIAGASRAAGAGLLALSGGPVGAAILGVSALAAGAFILSTRETDAERHAREFSAALRDQAAAAGVASAELDRQRQALTGVIDARVGVDQARTAVGTARTEVQRVQAAPAASFDGGEAGKRQALTAATNALTQAENNLRNARQSSASAGRVALTQAQAEQAAQAKNLDTANRAAQATGNLSRAQVQTALTTNLGRANALNFATALSRQARAQGEASSKLQASAAVARQSAAAVDTTTASGRKLAGQLRTEATESAKSAAAARVAAIATAERAIATDKAIASSKSSSKGEKAAAQARIKTAEGLVGSLRAAGLKAGQAQANGFAAGLRSRDGEIRTAGRQGGEKGAEGGRAAAPSADAAGQVVGSALGSGLIVGIDSRADEVYAAGLRLGQRGAQGTKDGAKSKSPSKLTIETGKDIAAGLIVGVKSEQGKVQSSIAASIAAAGRAGVRNAKTQGKFAAVAFGEGFKVTGPTFAGVISTTVSAALRDSITTAQSNLSGFGSALADLAGRAIDAAAPQFASRVAALDSRSAALDAASAQDQERELRNAVALAEAGKDQATKRYQALQAAAARRTPAQTAALSPLQAERERQRLEAARLAAEDPARAQRLALDQFLVQQDQNRLSAEQATAQKITDDKKAALDQQLADLTANLNAGAIKVGAFNTQVAGALRANGVDIALVGGQLGTAYVAAFNLALRQLKVQGAAVGAAPALPANFTPGIERPNQVAIAQAVETRNTIRQSLATELGRVRASQEANRQALQATFTKESSAGGTRIVASEQRQLTARAKEHREQIAAITALGKAIADAPPQVLIERLIAGAPGSDPSVVGDAVARSITRATTRKAKR